MLRILGSGGRNDRTGVSEVVGTLLILVMTVALFSVIIIWVYGFPAPEMEERVNLFPSMNRINDTEVNVSVIHRGGEAIQGSVIKVFFAIKNSTYSNLTVYNYSAGASSKYWTVGGSWSKDVSPMPEDAWVELRVVDTYHQSMLLRTELQRGDRGGSTVPILGAPIILPDWEVKADGRDTFYVKTAAVDYDGDLPNDGVKVDLSPLGSGLGIITFDHRGFGIFETALLSVPQSVSPGQYNLKVTATDRKGNTDTAWVTLKVISKDNEPPIVAFIRPNAGEIAAGMANIVAAIYSDPSGINKASVKLSVWEDNIPLDTSSKVVTDTTTSFRPFGGFKRDSMYIANISVEDNNGNIGYAETVFRMTFYSEPGNPRGETNFILMNKTWYSTVIFKYDDYIRVQLWSEILRRVDNSELRFTRSDVYTVMIQDRFVPNVSVPQFSDTFPYYVYDATVRIQTDGVYGSAIPPGFYTLTIMAAYPDMNVIYENDIRIEILYPDSSSPTNGRFFLYNESNKWVTSTNTFYSKERVYVQLISDKVLESALSPITVINKAIVTIKDIYGDTKLYVEVPRDQITYVGPGMGGYIYRFSFNLTDTVGGGQWLFGANWYPINIDVQTKSDWKRDQAWKWWKNYSSYQIEYSAGDQMRIIWPADISVVEADIILFHGDGTTLEENATIVAGEKLFINLVVRNLGDVDIYNAEVDVAVVSSGVTLASWGLETDSDFTDPNLNGWLESATGINYVATNLTWNTAIGGYPLALVLSSRVTVHLAILQPIIGGYGSEPIPETDYANNEAEKVILPESIGRLTVVDSGFATPAGVDVGEGAFMVMKLTCSAAGGAVRINGINISLSGTAADSDISRVSLFRDSNPNGILDRGDRLISRGTFVGKVFSATDSTIAVGTAQIVYLIVFDISPTAVASRTCGASITTRAQVHVVAPAYVVNVGFPLNSGLATITANSNQLTGTISGPNAAFLLTTTRYTIVWSGQNTVVAKAGQGSLTLTSLKMTITNPTYLTAIRLIDDYGQVIKELAPAATVTFTDINYRVLASAPRTMYIELDVSSTAVDASTIGIAISKTDPTLSCAADSISNLLSLTKTSTVRTMAYFFTYLAGGPTLDSTTRAYIYDIKVGVTDATVDVYAIGVSLAWSLPTRPDYVARIYIDGVLVFKDDGTNHVASGDLIPILQNPPKLNVAGKEIRIYFNTYVTGQVATEKKNDFYFMWSFADGSSSDGGKYIECLNANASYKTI